MNTKKAIITIKTRIAKSQYITTCLKTPYLISVREKQRCEVMTRLEILLSINFTLLCWISFQQNVACVSEKIEKNKKTKE